MRSFLLMCLVLAPWSAMAQDWRPRRKAPPPVPAAIADTAWFGRYRTPLPRPRGMLPAPGARVPGTIVTEAEPNDSLQTANLVALGDTVSGVISPVGDVDYFAVDLTAGTVLDLDVDAAQVGSDLDPVIALFDVDTFTVIIVNDDYDGLDSRITYLVPADGRYFVGIIDYGGGGGSTYTYSFRFGMRSVDEVEPNDTPAQANTIALGDSLVGVVAPGTDADYFTFPVPAGTYLRAELVSEYATALVLFDADGTTVLDSSDVFATYPVRVSARAATATTWYLKVRNRAGESNPGLYVLTLDSLRTGPGDPTTVFASGVNGPVLSVADSLGGLYVLGDFGTTIYHITPAGVVTTIVSGTFSATGMTLDGYGRLLVAAYGFESGQYGLYRVGTGGTLESVYALQGLAGDVEVGSDGDIWVANCLSTACPVIDRLSPFGTRKARIEVPAFPTYMAFSPTGALHFSDGFQNIYRVNGSSAQLVLTAAPYVEDFAFDADGYLYVANGFEGHLTLYSPAYQPVDAPFAATNIGGPTSLVFLRAATGMTARLLLAVAGYLQQPPYVNAVLEVNPAGVRAVGARVGVDLIAITPNALPAGVVGSDYSVPLAVGAGAPSGMTWSVAAGDLPGGLTLSASGGLLSGVLTASGSFRFTVRVDGGGRLGFREYQVQVTAPTVGVADAMDAAMGVTDALTTEQKRYLDIVGNNNGIFDIGDLRALLRRSGQLDRAGISGFTAVTGRN